MVNRTLRGQLIELISRSCLEENKYEFIDTFKESLQEHLNVNLKFETSVSDIRIENGIQCCDIYFDSVEGKKSVVMVHLVIQLDSKI